MTTIAWDGKTLAADTRMVGSTIDQGHTKKLRRTKANELVGYCGRISEALDFLEWFCNGEEPKDYPQGMMDFEALVIDEDGNAFVYEDRPHKISVTAPFAMGSGGQVALGAMLAGKTSEQAIKIAMKADPHTGGKVNTMKR